MWRVLECADWLAGHDAVGGVWERSDAISNTGARKKRTTMDRVKESVTRWDAARVVCWLGGIEEDK